jgi:inward rectifier potassium channel
VAEFRYISPQGRSNLTLYGLHRGFFEDLYHLWLRASWRRVFAVVAVLYLAVNAVFGAAYMWTGGVENARPHSYSDYYFFSVQTLATIGYGKMSPVSVPAHVLVAIESFIGICGVAIITGLMFAKFARPTARVIWSDVAVVANMDGVPALMFRVANARGNQVVEAQMRVGMLRSETTAEGMPVRRQHDLKLVRPSSMVFALSWLCVHRLEPGSPLYGETQESLAKVQAELYCSLTGLDADFSQTIHSRHSYSMADVLWGRRFEDIMGPLPDGRMGVNYTRFHGTAPAPLDLPKRG